MKISAINSINNRFAFKQNQIQKDSIDISRYYSTTTNSIKLSDLSDEEIETMLLDKIKEAAAKNMYSIYPYRETNAVKVLNEMLSKTDLYRCSLSNERLTEIYNVARNLNDKIALEGSKILLNKKI